MASRTTNPPDDEFDLTRFLWGDLPLIGESAGNERYSDPPAATSAFPSAGEDRLITETASIRETSPAWGAASHRRQEPASPDTTEVDAGRPIDAEDECEAEPDIDLDALAALAELADAGFAADDPASEALDDESAELVLDERSLSYGELTQRLHKEILPRLRSLAENKGYLTLGYLARAVAELQRSSAHLDEVRAFVERLDSPVLPSRARPGVRQLPIWAVRQAQERFGDLLSDQIEEHLVIKSFGYEGVPLSQCTRAFLVQAWMCHGLSRAEERALVDIVSAEVARVGGNPNDWSADAWSAREALVLDNLSLVARMARHYMGRGVELDDLLQFGALGLFRAVEKFKPDRVHRFVHYANNWVFQSITRHIADHSRLIRLPVHVQESGKDIAEVAASLYQSLEREPTLAEIADASSTSENVVRALLVTSRTISLVDPRARWEVGLLTSSDDLDEIIEAEELREVIQAALASLTEPQRDVLEQRFGLRDGKVRTLEEVGDARGVTRERIRQIESKALERLRHPSRAKLLKDYAALPQSITTFEPIPPMPIAAPAAKVLLSEFCTADQEIIRWLWGLDGRRQRSVRVTARHLQVPTRYVRDVSTRIVALYRARTAGLIDRLTATQRRAKGSIAAKPNQPTKRLRVHPGWMLGATDKTPADWTSRLFAGHLPTSPNAAMRHVAD